MEIADWQATSDLNDLYREIRRLDLEQNIAELDNFGFTIVEPDKVAPPGFADRLLEAILSIVEKRTGVRPDLKGGSTHIDLPRGTGDEHYWLLFEDRVFEEALMNPVGLALATYLLGESCVLSVQSALLKGPGKEPLGLHCDNVTIPSPFPPYAQVCNTTWLLTDYSKENGALCFVPGSHKLHRHPTAAERLNFENAVPVEAQRGSMVAWSGNQWHGAFPRTAPGLRVGMLFGFQRSYVRPFEPYKEKTPKEILDRNPPRFAKLMGQDVFQGFEAEGPDYAKIARMPQGLYD